MLRRCSWDHEILPYSSPSPCLLFYVVPGDDVYRVAAPNARGEYANLVPGLPYMELYNIEARSLQEFAPPSLTRDVGVQARSTD